MLDTLALMANNPKLAPAMRDRARALLDRQRGPEEPTARDRALPASFQEQIRLGSEAVAPATEAITVSAARPGIDVVFLALHGSYGEDGTIQGMLDLIGIPYVGSGTLASALAMDKVMAKRVFAAEGIPTPRGVVVERVEFKANPDEASCRASTIMPAVVKPVCEGSSIGMTMLADPAAMRAAL